ncbi:hypothetical protein VTJ49DRAFT_2920 [Mycothermus thermophilus]|uniref:O-methyltransferase C-terminal domain-containing protein n=1 Tax=Humicola insolens TaxID=85995 RepID=A0ABR3V942_HUMIN
MAYDFFTRQPVRNAHVYFMRRVLYLHEHNLEVCISILRNTAWAMGPDSRMIICDMVLPESVEPERSLEVYRMDLDMMTIGLKEKTVAEFEQMLDAAGLELVKVWRSGVGALVQIESRLARIRNGMSFFMNLDTNP